MKTERSAPQSGKRSLQTKLGLQASGGPRERKDGFGAAATVVGAGGAKEMCSKASGTASTMGAGSAELAVMPMVTQIEQSS